MTTPDNSWYNIGQTVALFILGVFTVISNWRVKKTADAVDKNTVKLDTAIVTQGTNATKIDAAMEHNTNVTEKTAAVVDVIHTLTNGKMSAVLKCLAEVTAAKADITQRMEDKTSAELALKDYLAHLEKLAKAVVPIT